LTFANQFIPSGYDSVRIQFRLAAMNLISTGGGPDNLDYVLVEISTNGGAYYSRMRIRGAVANNCYWPYSATGYAKVYFTPATEQVFAPANSGLQTTEGYSTCEIVFPGNVTQIGLRMTGRSSSSTDTWLVDNLVLTGENCLSTQSVAATICAGDAYTLPGGQVVTAAGVYADTLAGGGGCDTVITTTLTVNAVPNDTTFAEICDGDAYLLPGGASVSLAGTYIDTLTGTNTCDSLVTTLLTVRATQYLTDSVTICEGGTHTLANGTVVDTTGVYVVPFTNQFGCDSIHETWVWVETINEGVLVNGTTLTADQFGATYQWVDCDNGFSAISGATAQSFTPANNGNYAVVLTLNGCTDTSACQNVIVVGNTEPTLAPITLFPNPAQQSVKVIGLPVDFEGAIYLTDMQGRHIPAPMNGTGRERTLELTGLAKGLYFVELEGIGGVKLMVE
jgi:hypothetical protein